MSRSRSRLPFLSLVFLAAAGMAGCATTKPVEGPVPAVLQLSDLGVTLAMPEPNTVTRVETQASIGRFPAGVSVARIMLERSAGDQPPAMVIDTLTDPEALYWNELFDSVGNVREVTVIDPQSVSTRYVTIPQLLESSRRQKCRLCVIYGQNDVAANVSRSLGAVYDADTSDLIGLVFAEQMVDPDEELSPPADYPKGDKRHMDAHWLTARKFEALVRGFVLELISLDREPGAPVETTTQPTVAQPTSPVLPPPVKAAPNGR